jgi:hypothetical protein
MTCCCHEIDRFGDDVPTVGPLLRYHPTSCPRCDAAEKMQDGIKEGMRVRLEEFHIHPIEGIVTALDPCDGNACEYFPHPGETCGNDYVIIDTDDAHVYVRHQITLVDV